MQVLGLMGAAAESAVYMSNSREAQEQHEILGDALRDTAKMLGGIRVRQTLRRYDIEVAEEETPAPKIDETDHVLCACGHPRYSHMRAEDNCIVVAHGARCHCVRFRAAS
jgi:hypothetical protein